jgi:transposase
MDRKKNPTSPYPAAFRERAVRMVADHLDSHCSLTAAVRDIGQKPGCSGDSLRVWYKQAQRDAGREAGPTSAEKARIRELERENRELRQGEEDQETVQWTVSPTNGILKKASAYFAQAEFDRPYRK